MENGVFWRSDKTHPPGTSETGVTVPYLGISISNSIVYFILLTKQYEDKSLFSSQLHQSDYSAE